MLEQNIKIQKLKNPHDLEKTRDGQITKKNKDSFLMIDPRINNPENVEMLINKETKFFSLTLDKNGRVAKEEKISWRDLKKNDGVSVIIKNEAKKKKTYFTDTVQKVIFKL